MKTQHLLLALLLFLSTHKLVAQTTNNLNSVSTPFIEREMCKTKVTPAAIQMELSRDQNSYRQLLQQQTNIHRLAVTEYTLQIHIVRMDDGTGGISVATIRNEFTNWVNPYFAAVNAKFVECSPEHYINSSDYYNLSGDAEGNAMSVANNIPNVINIYFVNDPDGACGWARFPWDLPSDYIVIANGCANNQSTIVHELGHYFSLYHTHETAFGAESVTRTGSNSCYDCDTKGDKLCDTPADPTLSNGSVSISAAPGCAYSSTLTDGCGVTYTPDPTLIMSYSLKPCRTVFSASQKSKMSLTMSSASGAPLYGRNYLQTSCPCERPQANCKNITVNLSSTGSAAITPTSVDNNSSWDCGFGSWSVSPNTFNCSNKGNNVVTLTVTDALGWVSTCQSNVLIADVTNPQVTTPASNLTVQCNGSGNITEYNNWLNNNGGAVANDECGGSWSYATDPFVSGCGGTGSRAVTFSFTDPSGNSASTTATFTIVDNTNPEVTCPANIHLPECVSIATWTVAASDVCGNVTIVSSPPSGSSFPKGVTTPVYVTVSDECGNSNTCSFNVYRDPELAVAVPAVATSSLNTCALGTAANIVLGYGGGPTCRTMNAVGSGGHAPLSYSWTKPSIVPSGSFTNSATSAATFCADFQSAPCVSYTFNVTVTDIHGCSKSNNAEVKVVNPLCTAGKNAKVGVCHTTNGSHSNGNSLCVGSSAVGTHMPQHLDCLGDCNASCVSYAARMKEPVADNIDPKFYQVSIQPNPFSSNTIIKINSEKSVKARLTVMDYSGRILAVPFAGMLKENVSTYVEFNAGELQSGMYIARLVTEDGVVTTSTMIIAK